MWPCFYLMLQTCSKCLTQEQLMKIIVWLVVFCSMAVFICAYEFVFMHVHVHACACVRLCVCVAASYGPSGLCVCHLECQVSVCPRTPLFLILQRPWTACVCLSICVYSVAGRGKHSPGESHYELRVCERGCVYVCVLTTDQVSLRITAVRR